MQTTLAIEAFLDDRRARGCAPKTLVFYAWQLGRLAGFDELPDAPTLRHLLAGIAGSPASRDSAYRALHAFYCWLESEDLLADNPFGRRGSRPARVARPRLPRIRQRTLDRGEVLALLQLHLSARDRAIVELVLDTGLRRGALASLRARDLHDGWIGVHTKGRDHEVPVHRDVLAQLRELCRGCGPDDAVFRAADGHGLSAQSISLRVREALDAAGLRQGGKAGPHMLRHTFGRHWRSSGGDLASLQKILGHRQIATTMIYVDLSADELAAAHAAYSTLTQTDDNKVRRVK